MKKDSQAVQDLHTCMMEFDDEPFNRSLPTLRSLQSSLVASPECVHDLETAISDGQRQIDTFLQERVFIKTKPLSATIHKNKRRCFAAEQVCKPSGATMKVAQMERTGLLALVNLVEGSRMIHLEDVLDRRVTEECLSVYNVDGSMRKTAKVKCLNCSTGTQ
jgi:hypothetical protein